MYSLLYPLSSKNRVQFRYVRDGAGSYRCPEGGSVNGAWLTAARYIFTVEPMGAPRMTKSDRWKTDPNHPNPRKRQRPAVTQYFAFQNALLPQANLQRFRIGNRIDVIFYISMPPSWSIKKKNEMRGKPHKQKPDTDNLIKAFCDALTGDDSQIWDKRGRKFWADRGSIEVMLNEFDVDAKEVA